VHVGISICAEHAVASRAQADNVAPPHIGEEFGDKEDHRRQGNSQHHHRRTAWTPGWFENTSYQHR
jgi:hypothetical protein